MIFQLDEVSHTMKMVKATSSCIVHFSKKQSFSNGRRALVEINNDEHQSK